MGAACLGLLLLAGSTPGLAAERSLAVGYLDIADDPRYERRHLRSRLRAQPWGRPYPGAELAVHESRFQVAAIGVELELHLESAANTEAAIDAVRGLRASGSRFVLVDAPANTVAALAAATRELGVQLFNVSAVDDRLRAADCAPHLLHLAPSRAMLMDALGQFLVRRKWREVLVLKGPAAADAEMLSAFERTAKRYRLDLTETRSFVLGNDPRERERNNVSLLTGGADYDLVFVADASGQFAKEVPYQLRSPRPTAGGGGLVADWWHWAWERHGAPQLNRRFLEQAGRPMTGYDWAAWIGVKAIIEAAVRTGGTEYEAMVGYLRGPELVLDGFKGHRLNFRDWDGQLRQPVFLTSGDWVVARAPMEGFLHATNKLDTLGFDRRESPCRSRSQP